MENYKVYIHGRPQGQDCYPSWDIDDSFYIKPFLDTRIGKQWNSVLISDMFQGNSYYTYLVNKNVVEYNARRDNAYFAITVRFDNTYCKKVHLLYELLNAVFKKKCVGTLIQGNAQEGMQFLVSKLSEKEKLLVEIRSIIHSNVESLLSSYVSPIENAKETTQSMPKYYSLDEVDSMVFVSDMLTSKVVVSPDIPSALDRLNSLSGIKTEYDKLRAQYKEQSKENRQLQEERDSLKKKLKNNDAESLKAANKIAEQKKEIENLKTDKSIFQTIDLNKESIIQFARLVASRFPERFKMDFQDVPLRPKKPSSSFNPKDWLPVGNFVLLLALLILNICSMVNNKGGGTGTDTDSTQVDTTNVDSVKTDSVTLNTKVRIDIGEYSSGNLIIKKVYPLTIKVDDKTYNGGVLEVKGGTIDANNKLTVEDSPVEISYIKDGKILAQRKLNASEQDTQISSKDQTSRGNGKSAGKKDHTSNSNTQNNKTNESTESNNGDGQGS